ncbi:hypothetical protein BDV96DRAFT_594246 [Lophiotrema nucula]|uniref:Uncharacterized protein n=1 Tax=Lophiotrema nucula TaxID=690887 RepID=A0A6A5ZVH7_9PLEO|nr:hypothetical protein BDV96DRAFT_594246 [Lophiotrema nucula]
MCCSKSLLDKESQSVQQGRLTVGPMQPTASQPDDYPQARLTAVECPLEHAQFDKQGRRMSARYTFDSMKQFITHLRHVHPSLIKQKGTEELKEVRKEFAALLREATRVWSSQSLLSIVRSNTRSLIQVDRQTMPTTPLKASESTYEAVIPVSTSKKTIKS